MSEVIGGFSLKAPLVPPFGPPLGPLKESKILSNEFQTGLSIFLVSFVGKKANYTGPVI